MPGAVGSASPMLSRCVVAGHTHAAKSTLILLLNFNSLSPVFGLWVDHCVMEPKQLEADGKRIRVVAAIILYFIAVAVIVGLVVSYLHAHSAG